MANIMDGIQMNRYIVTSIKDPEDDTFQVGDHIILNEDGTVSCIEAGGWLEKEDAQEALNNITYEFDKEYYNKKWKELGKYFDDLQKMAEQSNIVLGDNIGEK